MNNIDEKILMAEEEIKQLQKKKAHQSTETGRTQKER